MVILKYTLGGLFAGAIFASGCVFNHVSRDLVVVGYELLMSGFITFGLVRYWETH